jgi:hypothetical protein
MNKMHAIFTAAARKKNIYLKYSCLISLVRHRSGAVHEGVRQSPKSDALPVIMFCE